MVIRGLVWVCLLRGREFALPLWGRTLVCFQTVFLIFHSRLCLVSSSVPGFKDRAGRSREQARAQKWCIDSRASDVRSVTDAKGDAMLSKQDEANVVVSGACPPCAGLGSLSGSKVGRPSVNSWILVRHLMHVSHTLMPCFLLLLVTCCLRCCTSLCTFICCCWVVHAR